MRYFEKKSEPVVTPKKLKLNPWLAGALISTGILGTGYGIHRLTKKPDRGWLR